MSEFWAVPRVTGFSGFNARLRNSDNALVSSSLMSASSSIISIFWISCEVRNPSKKCMNGTRDLMAIRWAMPARSITSCTLPEASMAKPV